MAEPRPDAPTICDPDRADRRASRPSYAPTDQALLASKVAARASEAGFESLLDYYYFLRYDADSAR